MQIYTQVNHVYQYDLQLTQILTTYNKLLEELRHKTINYTRSILCPNFWLQLSPYINFNKYFIFDIFNYIIIKNIL